MEVQREDFATEAFAENIPSKQAGVFYPTQWTYMLRQLQEPEEPKHWYANLHAKRGKSKKRITFNLNSDSLNLKLQKSSKS